MLSQASDHAGRSPDASPSPHETRDIKISQLSDSGSSLEAIRLFPDQIRETVRLFQCPRCSYPMKDPVTLSCGNTLCKGCIPPTYVRPFISYPATNERRHGFECPFSECKKEHAMQDCSPDVTLSRILADTQLGVDEGRGQDGGSRYEVMITIKTQWPLAGVAGVAPRPETKQASPMQGGRFLATYALAERGELDYFAEVTYSDTVDEKDGDRFDITIIESVKGKIRAEVDCHICYGMFYDPLTTACGHTFCRHCLQRVLDHAPQCPICRRTLSMPSADRETRPSNSLIKRTTTAFWSEDLAARKEAIATENSISPSPEFDSAIFVCTLAFPLMPTFLHVFEPRYRLMIRRALEADRTFGMVLHQGSSFFGGPSFYDTGTMLRIQNVEFFADGRSLIETVGIGRFRLLRQGVLDGYMIGQTEKIHDISVAEEEELEARETRVALSPVSSKSSMTLPTSPEPSSNTASSPSTSPSEVATTPTLPEHLETMPTKDLMDFAVDFVTRMQEQSVGWLTTRVLSIYGECPRDPATFPWWFASILPVRDEEKQRLLSTTSVRSRLKVCCRWIMEWESSRWSLSTTCLMM